MGFDAGAVVEPLDWDFTKFDAGKGVIPEPTDAQIDRLFKDIAGMSKEIMSKAGLPEGEATPEELLAALANLPDDVDFGIGDMMKTMSKIFAKLCTNQPTQAQLMKLPLRIRMRFFVWLAGELRPEDFGPASTSPARGNGQVLQLPPAFTRNVG